MRGSEVGDEEGQEWGRKGGSWGKVVEKGGKGSKVGD
jgi:hypothetical protein